MPPELKIFSGRANPQLAQNVCRFLNLPMGDCKFQTFPDGEIHCKIEDVRGRDVFLMQSTSPPVNDHLMELLIMIDTCMRASAERITAVLPYYGYARQDRKDEGRVPITAKLVANMLTRAGANRVLTMDLHAAQIQGFFDLPVDHLYAASVLNHYFLSQNLSPEELVIVSPDEGSIKRAVGHATRLGGELAIIDKRRTGAETTTQENIIGGSLEGKVALMFDDMISTAGSICGAAELVKKQGAREIHVAATHGLFAGKAIERLEKAPIDSIVVTDSVPLEPEKQLPKIKVLSVASILGEAIKRIHQHESISEIFEGESSRTESS
ncbi:MAG: ribose-phosphate pyrophosphokinase [Planctomycetota bacterium]|nr:ribose-phosphate pyrophosphokinase [Planctomycetota bacterium]